MNVLIVDDHALVRAGMRLLLEQEADITVVGEATSLDDLPVDGPPIDVVIADLMLGVSQGGDVVRKLCATFPEAAILAVTMMSAPDAAIEAINAGARGFVPKHAAATELVEALHRVAAGERYMQPAIGAAIAAAQGASPADGRALSPRELDVLRLLARGHTNAEIAAELGIGLRTAEAHRASATRKLGLRTRADIVRYCAETGIAGVSAH